MIEFWRGERRVERVSGCRLTAGPGNWAFAAQNADEIERHWTKRCSQSPGFFNGTVYMLAEHNLEAAEFCGRLIPVEFKSFLFWKDAGYPDTSLRDCFGSALIRSNDGHVLLGRQRAGNVNPGLFYLPGGFIDGRDVNGDGEIDIRTSIARELEEETGLQVDGSIRAPQMLVTFDGPMISLAMELRFDSPAETLVGRIQQFILREPGSELEEVLAVGSVEDLAGLKMQDYARTLLASVLRPD